MKYTPPVWVRFNVEQLIRCYKEYIRLAKMLIKKGKRK